MDNMDEHDESPPLSPASLDSISINTDDIPYIQDGRIDLELDSKLGRVMTKMVTPYYPDSPLTLEDQGEDVSLSFEDIRCSISLNIVIQVVGSRGDVQPFIALATELQKHGHRVRIATHNVFEDFVLGSGIEFYPIGGDPAQLMAYMVKNPGLIPSMKTLQEGEIQRKRAMITEMLHGCWSSCIEPDPKTNVPFVAQAIIANPVSFAHLHCAQALSIPVHLMFTMPWTSTRAFPHPLANIKNSIHEPTMTNYISYGMVDWMTWQGVGDVINTWRESLYLEPVPTSEGPFLASTLQIPHTYCWSAALIPKPADWPSYIDVCGFFFRDAPSYEAPPELTQFLAAGPPPVYIGFGSIVIDNPARLTRILLEAIKISGVRAIISRGWSKIGEASSSADVFYLDDCPHEWLFQKVSAVVHHGGAGTTACGLLNARPTVVVPFFGDQPFWGQMIANAGAGPEPIPQKALSSENLAAAIEFCLTSAAAEAATEISAKMRNENGVQQAVASFHCHLPQDRMSCELLPDQPAVWFYTKSKPSVRLSHLAVERLSLAQDVNFKRKHLKHYGPSPFLIQNQRWDPLTATATSSARFGYNIAKSTTGIFADPARVYIDRRNSSKDDGQGESSTKTHGKAALASAKSFNNLVSGAVKGGTVEVPLAIAEGFRNVPRLWGEKVAKQEEITGFGSGAKVAGKNLVHGFHDGFGGFFYKPYQGARKEGAVGFAKGFGRGLGGILTQPLSGAFGALGYTGKGVVRSIHTSLHQETMKAVLEAKRAEGRHLAQGEQQIDTADEEIVASFQRAAGKSAS